MEKIILVIDDEERVKKSLEEAFPEYRFIGAENGENGLAELSKPNEIDLVILDMKLSDASGIDVLKKIKASYPGLGVIMLTGYGSKDAVVEALRGHADDFIDKPFDDDELRDKIGRLLERRNHEARENGTDQTAIERVVRLLERNYDKDLTLDHAAKVASLSPKYISRLFKQSMRKSFTDFKIWLRMEKGKEMLKKTSLPVSLIAERTGYENAESFMKTFKKTVRCTPTEYRSQAQSRKTRKSPETRSPR